MKIRFGNPERSRVPITSVGVGGFKSVSKPQSIQISRLTILAGANSAGKSSIMQGLLLLKQTLEAQYDPGPLLLNGPNVRFSAVEQMVHRGASRDKHDISLHLSLADGTGFDVAFHHTAGRPLEIRSSVFRSKETDSLTVHPNLTEIELLKSLGLPSKTLPARMFSASVERSRCFLKPKLAIAETDQSDLKHELMFELFNALQSAERRTSLESYTQSIRSVIHLPGLRGNPERSYPLSATGEVFPGTFPPYVATVVASWSKTHDERLKTLGQNLKELGLTWKVTAEPLDDTRVELRVGRLMRPTQGGAKDLVNIADVGVGVSQTLPVVVALLAARDGDLLYIEQPEIHLHPRAQTRMAQLLVTAANRGVRVVVETHSSLLLLGIQKLIAEQEIPNEDVVFHWFQREPTTGVTQITSVQPDFAGRTASWPADFDDVSLETTAAFLDASEAAEAAHE